MPFCSIDHPSHRSSGHTETMSAIVFILLTGVALFLSGCQSAGNSHPDIKLGWEIIPDPPVAGEATIRITLTDSTGQLVEGAEVELEGNMSHPGMKPVFSTAEELEPGYYSAPVEFTMGGDWFFLIRAKLDDERVVERQINIPGVRSESQ